MSGIATCGEMRGVNDINGTASLGFQTNASSTWDTIGIYELSTEQNLFGTFDVGLYGLDTVTLNLTTSTSGNTTAKAHSQTVAGVATADFWLGQLGLGTQLGNFTVQNENIPSLLDTLKNQSLIPSLSFGYSAGAAYSSPEDFGSLVLGGYDKTRLDSSNLTVALGGEKNQTLGVSVQSIVAQNAFGGTISLSTSSSPLVATIDSAVSQLWLPQSVCDLFAQAFGLTYDSSTGLYLVNGTIHSQLLDMKPSVTFAIGANDTAQTSATTNVVLPYSAFNLQAGIPIYNFSTNYFPIRVAANETQYVLGRTFLQEAYVFVDWERQNFTIAQAVHQNSTKNIVPVLSPSDNASASPQKDLSTGAIAGIAVGACAAILSAVGLVLFFVIRNRRRRRAGDAKHAEETEQAAAFLPDKKGGEAAELHSDHVKPPEIMSTQIYELQDDDKGHEAMSTPIAEMPGHVAEQELEGDTVMLSKKEKTEGKRNSVYELP